MTTQQKQDKYNKRMAAKTTIASKNTGTIKPSEFIPKIGILGETDTIVFHCDAEPSNYTKKNGEKIRNTLGHLFDHNQFDSVRNNEQSLKAVTIMATEYVRAFFPKSYQSAVMMKANIAITLFRQPTEGRYGARSLGSFPINDTDGVLDVSNCPFQGNGVPFLYLYKQDEENNRIASDSIYWTIKNKVEAIFA
jgi:hypothetical protein